MQTPDTKAAAVPSDLARGLRIGIVASRFNPEITDRLRDGALGVLRTMGADVAQCPVAAVAGAFEIPVVARALAQRADIDGVVCVGCVIRGETDHYDHICRTAADGIARIALDTGKPTGLGLLTAPTRAHAEARAGGTYGNMGAHAAAAVVEAIRALRSINSKS